MTQFRFLKKTAIAFCFVFILLRFSSFYGQEVPAMPAAENASDTDISEPLEIKLSVNEVRLDVVVLDKKNGNPITDLTADDFEVFQDNRRQEIKSSVYIDSQPDANGQTAAPQKETRNLPSSLKTALKSEDARRTILFIVDGYAMSFENGYHSKMALRNFVEKQMLPGDLVSILRTDYGNSVLNMFQYDKRELLARINAMPTTMAPDSGEVSSSTYQDFLRRQNEKQISALSYGLHALKNMPGRKFLIMITPANVDFKSQQFIGFSDPYRRLADGALRAGVVVNYLDVNGLKYFSPENDVLKTLISKPGNAQADILAHIRSMSNVQIHEINPLPALTGGITINDNNFFLEGIGKEVESLMRGYYLISYEPPSDTFETRGKKDDLYRSVKIRVNRKDATVHTRSGFFGRLESEIDADTTKQNPLIAAILSPFQSTDLNINIAAGYIKNVQAGYLVRSWIHLDPKDVEIIETEDGGALIGLETLCVTSDINGKLQDLRHVKYDFDISPENKAENIAWIKEHGVRFSLLLPVKKPESYYIQISVQDTKSGKVGSAYQFLEIPDLNKKGLALSDIFILNSADDLIWMNSDVTEELAKGEFSLVFQSEEVQTPALRTYMSGDNFQTLTMIYNADAKAIARSEIETQSVLYKDGAVFLRGEPRPIALEKVDALDSIPILHKMIIGQDMPPGDYLLQLVTTDKKNSKKKEGNASQTLSFTIIEKKVQPIPKPLNER